MWKTLPEEIRNQQPKGKYSFTACPTESMTTMETLAEDKKYKFCPRDQRFGDDDSGCYFEMMGLKNWWPQQRCWKRKMSTRYQRWQRKHQLRKQKIQRVWVNVSDSGGAGVFTGSLRFDGDNGGGDWGSRRYNTSEWTSLKAEAPVCLRKKGIDRKHSNVGRVSWVKGLSKDEGDIGIGQGIRETNIWQQRMRQKRKASTETTTMKTYASA